MRRNSSVPQWIITAAWPYVNASPHLGSVLHLLTGDVISRYLRLKGDTVLYVSGSDAHGTPISVMAEQQGISPYDLAFTHHQEYLALLRHWNIAFDNYTITHSPNHITFCQEFYRQLDRNGHIFQASDQHLFCRDCQRYLPDRYVTGTCPHCGAPDSRGDECTNPECGRPLVSNELVDPRCTNCGSTPITKETIHWYFDLPKFSSQLQALLKDRMQLTDAAHNFVKRFMREGLRPRPITRDLTWGIPVDDTFQDARGKVLYVWAEAVLGYISATKEWAEKAGTSLLWKTMWQNSSTKTVFCIGKDNTIFHAVIFPALLMAHPEPYVLPHAITVTEFILFEGEPFSKTKGVGIGATEALVLAPADCWRYFLLVNRPETKDFNFTWSLFVETVNQDLNNTLGNFIHRTLTFIDTHFDQQVPPQGRLANPDRRMLAHIARSVRQQAECMTEFRVKESLIAVLALAHAGNAYLSSQEPWNTIRDDRTAAETTLNVAMQVVNALAVLIHPYMPATAQAIRKMLSLPPNIGDRELRLLSKSPLPAQHSISKPHPLFKKIQEQAIKNKLEHARRMR